MSYCSRSDLNLPAHVLVELTDDEGLSSDLNDLDTSVSDNPLIATRISEEITKADGLIDGHLRIHYSVPLESTPALVKQWSHDLTIYGLYRRRAHVFTGVPENIRMVYEDTMDMLRRVRSGLLDLGVEPPPAVSTGAASEAESETALFTADTLEDF